MQEVFIWAGKPSTSQGVKKANFHVFRETKAPAILIEIGFIDNTKDNIIFDTKFDEIIAAMTKAILEQVGIQYETSKPIVNEKILYRVMAGSYANKDNAQRQVDKLKMAGFEAVIMPYKT
ncbi:MAG: hypothetical protein GX366_00795 [Epulopiscium sp.]|nr:hypothetical protein [Candidatus Epulonipiscium sp.]